MLLSSIKSRKERLKRNNHLKKSSSQWTARPKKRRIPTKEKAAQLFYFTIEKKESAFELLINSIEPWKENTKSGNHVREKHLSMVQYVPKDENIDMQRVA